MFAAFCLLAVISVAASAAVPKPLPHFLKYVSNEERRDFLEALNKGSISSIDVRDELIFWSEEMGGNIEALMPLYIEELERFEEEQRQKAEWQKKLKRMSAVTSKKPAGESKPKSRKSRDLKKWVRVEDYVDYSQ